MVEFTAPWPLPHEQVLLQELNHRINNEFTTAISFVSLAAASSRNDKVKTALTAVAEMLHHYAHVHRSDFRLRLSLCCCRRIVVGGWE